MFNYIFTFRFYYCFDWDYSAGLLNMTAVNLKEGKEMPLGSFSDSDNHFFQAIAILFARV
jgi:hypothetical protein